jgi:site-specific DNA-methyltransferase (adenine-specific)/site-specific DNA-methyltransferase (cytosine-N4-specific)
MGSGTTLFAAEKLKRNSIGIDILEEYCEMVKAEIKEKELYLFETEDEYALVNK